MGHWYDSDGNPRHWQPDGKDTTLRHARKQNLCWSVTSVTSYKHNEGLVRWMKSQVANAALTLPEKEGESADDRKKRILTDAFTEVDVAKDFGSATHQVLEDYPDHKIPDDFPEAVDAARPAMDWLDAHVQKTIGNEYSFRYSGFGGCIDKIAELKDGRLAVIDYKTKDPGKRGLPVYDDWVIQLAAYERFVRHLTGREASVISMVVSRQEPYEIKVKEWTEEKREQGWVEFCGLMLGMMSARKYWPADIYDRDGVMATLQNIHPV